MQKQEVKKTLHQVYQVEDQFHDHKFQAEILHNLNILETLLSKDLRNQKLEAQCLMN